MKKKFLHKVRLTDDILMTLMHSFLHYANNKLFTYMLSKSRLEREILVILSCPKSHELYDEINDFYNVHIRNILNKNKKVQICMTQSQYNDFFEFISEELLFDTVAQSFIYNKEEQIFIKPVMYIGFHSIQSLFNLFPDILFHTSILHKNTVIINRNMTPFIRKGKLAQPVLSFIKQHLNKHALLLQNESVYYQKMLSGISLHLTLLRQELLRLEGIYGFPVSFEIAFSPFNINEAPTCHIHFSTDIQVSFSLIEDKREDVFFHEYKHNNYGYIYDIFEKNIYSILESLFINKQKTIIQNTTQTLRVTSLSTRI